MTKRLRWHRRGSGLVAAAVLALVAALAVAAPASANTALGGWLNENCSAYHPDLIYSCYFLTDSKGDFMIWSYDAACDSVLEGNWCLVGVGFYHKLDSTGKKWYWQIIDPACDNKGPYLNSTGAGGCGHSAQGAWNSTISGFHLNWGGAIVPQGYGVWYNPPTTIDTNHHWDCTWGFVTVPGTGESALCATLAIAYG